MNVLKVRDFMDRNPIVISPNLNIYDAMDVFLHNKINSAGVIDNSGNLIGILSEKDCLQAFVNGVYDKVPGRDVADYMTKEVTTIHPDRDILYAASIFLSNPFRRILVTENDKIVGQVTRLDILRAIKKMDGKKNFNPITGRYELEDRTRTIAKFF